MSDKFELCLALRTYKAQSVNGSVHGRSRLVKAVLPARKQTWITSYEG